MQQVVLYIELISALLLIALVLVQRSSGDVGGAFGGDGAQFSRTRRGLERGIFFATVTVSVLFTVSSTLMLFGA